MATVSDAAAANVGGDPNPGATGLPTLAVTSVVNPPVVTPAVPEGPLNHHEQPEKFTGVNFQKMAAEDAVLFDYSEPCAVSE